MRRILPSSTPKQLCIVVRIQHTTPIYGYSRRARQALSNDAFIANFNVVTAEHEHRTVEKPSWCSAQPPAACCFDNENAPALRRMRLEFCAPGLPSPLLRLPPALAAHSLRREVNWTVTPYAAFPLVLLDRPKGSVLPSIRPLSLQIAQAEFFDLF